MQEAVTRRGMIWASLAALVAGGARPLLAWSKHGDGLPPIFPLPDRSTSVMLWSHDFGSRVVGRISVARDCVPGTCSYDWYENHEHGNGAYKMRVIVRKRFVGPSYARGVVFADQGDYLKRGPAIAEEMRNSASKQATLILTGRDEAARGMRPREELGEVVYCTQ